MHFHPWVIPFCIWLHPWDIWILLEYSSKKVMLHVARICSTFCRYTVQLRMITLILLNTSLTVVQKWKLCWWLSNRRTHLSYAVWSSLTKWMWIIYTPWKMVQFCMLQQQRDLWKSWKSLLKKVTLWAWGMRSMTIQYTRLALNGHVDIVRYLAGTGCSGSLPGEMLDINYEKKEYQ